MVRKKKIQVPTRAEGDPTGQTQMLQAQIDAVSPGQEAELPAAPRVAQAAQPPIDIFNTPTQKLEQPGNELGENETVFSAQNDIEIVKAILLEKFPSLTSRF